MMLSASSLSDIDFTVQIFNINNPVFRVYKLENLKRDLIIHGVVTGTKSVNQSLLLKLAYLEETYPSYFQDFIHLARTTRHNLNYCLTLTKGKIRYDMKEKQPIFDTSEHLVENLFEAVTKNNVPMFHYILQEMFLEPYSTDFCESIMERHSSYLQIQKLVADHEKNPQRSAV